jgi:hypothetical protein
LLLGLHQLSCGKVLTCLLVMAVRVEGASTLHVALHFVRHGAFHDGSDPGYQIRPVNFVTAS